MISLQVLNHLIYEGIALCENLAICSAGKITGEDLKPHLRRMHLVVTALREFVQSVEIYGQLECTSKEDKNHLSELQGKVLFLLFRKHLFIFNTKSNL